MSKAITHTLDGETTISGDRWENLARVITRMCGDDRDDDEGLANARLIAAAPDLLATLKAALPLLHTSDDLPIHYFADRPGVLGDALRVIAKIEGELK